jgi:hypothetical protein
MDPERSRPEPDESSIHRRQICGTLLVATLLGVLLVGLLVLTVFHPLRWSTGSHGLYIGRIAYLVPDSTSIPRGPMVRLPVRFEGGKAVWSQPSSHVPATEVHFFDFRIW